MNLVWIKTNGKEDLNNGSNKEIAMKELYQI